MCSGTSVWSVESCQDWAAGWSTWPFIEPGRDVMGSQTSILWLATPFWADPNPQKPITWEFSTSQGTYLIRLPTGHFGTFLVFCQVFKQCGGKWVTQFTYLILTTVLWGGIYNCQHRIQKARLREVKQVARGHTESQSRVLDLNSKGIAFVIQVLKHIRGVNPGSNQPLSSVYFTSWL